MMKIRKVLLSLLSFIILFIISGCFNNSSFQIYEYDLNEEIRFLLKDDYEKYVIENEDIKLSVIISKDKNSNNYEINIYINDNVISCNEYKGFDNIKRFDESPSTLRLYYMNNIFILDSSIPSIYDCDSLIIFDYNGTILADFYGIDVEIDLESYSILIIDRLEGNDDNKPMEITSYKKYIVSNCNLMLIDSWETK